jgi:hypothetical protein
MMNLLEDEISKFKVMLKEFKYIVFNISKDIL